MSSAPACLLAAARPRARAASPVSPPLEGQCAPRGASLAASETCADTRAHRAGRELLASLASADDRRSLSLRYRLERLKLSPADRAALPDEYNRGGDGSGAGPNASTTDSYNVGLELEEGPAPLLDSWGITDPDPKHPDGSRDLGPACFLDRASPDSERGHGPPLEYLAAVELETAAHRERRAKRHELSVNAAMHGFRIVRKNQAEHRELFELEENGRARGPAERAMRWHRGRASGNRERFARTLDCGKKKVAVACNACGCAHEVPSRCSCQRICLACRDVAKKKRLARVAVAQQRVLKSAQRRGLLRAERRGGRWGQRMITLTVPRELLTDRWELESLAAPADVTIRIDTLFRAWRAFSIRLQRWARGFGRQGRVEYYRGFEWTPAEDGRGHPHFHVWIFSPFLDREDVRSWWRAALEEVGRLAPARRRGIGAARCTTRELELELLETCEKPRARARACKLRNLERRPALSRVCRTRRDPAVRRHRLLATCARLDHVIVDVRAGRLGSGILHEAAKGRVTLEAENGERIVRYLEGWSIVDVYADTGGRIDPAVLARLYEALDARRIVQTSRGLLDPRELGCSACGSQRTTFVEVFDPRWPSRSSSSSSSCPDTVRSCRAPP